MRTMKKSALACLLLLLSAFVLRAEELVYDLPADWEAGVRYEEVSSRLRISGGELISPMSPIGGPALPYLAVTLPLDKDALVDEVTCEGAFETIDTPLRPLVIAEPHRLGESPRVTAEDPALFGAALYPAQSVSHSRQTFSGKSVLLLHVTPYRWNGTEGILEKATSLRVRVSYSRPKLLKRAAAEATTSRLSDVEAALEKIDMVVISPPAWTNLWPLYVEYRKTTHPDLTIIIKNTDEIYATYDGADDALKIHHYLEDLYANKNLKYAILGAGCAKGTYDRTKEIPTRACYAINGLSSVSDLYYSCMEKKGGAEVWDYDGDGAYLAVKNAGGGYSGDSADRVDWTPEIACFRFPVREQGQVRGITSKTLRTYTAEEQVKGLVEKLKRVEGGDFAGDFKIGYSGDFVFTSWGRGNTSDRMAGEARFFDGRLNLWDADHAANSQDWEIMMRYNIRSYIASARPLADVFCADSVDAAGNIYNRDLEFNTHAAHGQDQTTTPFEAYNFFTTSKIQKFLDFSHSCRTGRFDLNNYSGNGNLCFGEASVLNPKGGALVTINNTRVTWASTLDDEWCALLMQVSFIQGLFSLGDGTAAGSFIEGHNRVIQRAGQFAPASYMAGCYVIANMMGDPLVSLAKDKEAIQKEMTLAGAVEATEPLLATTLTLNPDEGADEITVSGAGKVKAFQNLVVNAPTLTFSAPGGVAGGGLTFAEAGGTLRLSGNSERYFGPRFTNLKTITVTGSGATLDFDKTGKVREVSTLSFTDGGENTIRCREGGIFSTDLTIPVSNATLVLQTVNVGGVRDGRGDVPLFALDHATLKITENPHWATENLSRTVTMKDSTLDVEYSKAGFGPFVNNAGFNLDVLSGSNKVVGAASGISLSGLVKMDVAEGANLSIEVPLVKSSYPGTLLKTGAGTLELRASHTFENGLVISNGTVVAGAESSRTLGAGAVVVEEGATLTLEAIPVADIKSLTVKRGGRLILPGDATKASYQLVDPLTSTLQFEEGAEVYNENDLESPLEGNVTADGYFMNTENFLNWGEADGTWSNTSDETPWLDKSSAAAAFADGDSVQFLDRDAQTLAVAVAGAVNPDYVNFANHATSYRFTKGDDAALLSVPNLYTVGETVFEADVKASAKAIVTQGTTTFSNLVTAVASVQDGAALRVTGTLSPLAKISKVVLNVTKFQCSQIFVGAWYDSYHAGCQVNGLEFLNDGKRVPLPVGTKVTAKFSYTNTAKNRVSVEDTMTVTKLDENGYVSECSGTSTITNLVDASASTGWGGGEGGNTLISATPTYSITIDLGSPIEMFSAYRLAGGNSAARSPASWSLTVTEDSTSKATVVDSKSVSLSANAWWTSGAVSLAGSGDGSFTVSPGARLYCDGVINHSLTLSDGATLAITNSESMVIGNGMKMEGSVILDVGEADLFPWTQVTTGANLQMSDLAAFSVKDDAAALQILDGELYVATQNVTPGPYERTLSGDCAWNSADFTADGTSFKDTWSETATLVTETATLTVTNNATLDIDTDVCLNTVRVVSAPGATPTLKVTGDKRLYASTLDFSDFAGSVIWGVDLNGASVICGTNEVTLLKGDGATLSVAANGIAHLAGSFDTYAIDATSRLDFIGENRTIDYSTLPDAGVFSFEDAVLKGPFGKTDVTFLVEDGDALTLKPTNDALATPTTESVDLRGGALAVDAAAAWRFGANGLTSFTMTGGAFSCAATGTTLASDESGLVLGCTAGSSFPAELNLAGGVFALTNGVLNFNEAGSLTLLGDARARVLGIGAVGGNAGEVTVSEQGVLELGALSIPRNAATLTLNGGTLAAYEKGASVGPDLTVTGRGTLAADDGTTLAVKGRVSGDGVLVIGDETHAGEVSLANEPTLEAVVVSNGTWRVGALRPTSATLLPSPGTLAVTLSNDEIESAMATPLKLIKASEVPTGGVKVYNKKGTLQEGATAEIVDGFLVLRAAAASTDSEEGGDSFSINFIGGNSNRPGRKITSGAAGAYEVEAAAWNQLAQKSDNSKVAETRTELTEVLADGTWRTTPVSLNATAACAYTVNVTPENANGELLYGYLDDGTPGATVTLGNIPYEKYDLYVYPGNDLSQPQFGPVTVTVGGETRVLPEGGAGWGDSATVTGEVALVEGQNYLRFTDLSGDSLTVRGSVKSSGARGGISAIQVVNTARRRETYTWAGEALGAWFSDAASWRRESGAFAAWPQDGSAANAVIDSTATITISDAVETFSLIAGAGDAVDQTLTIEKGASLTVLADGDDGFVLGRDTGSLTRLVVDGGSLVSESSPLILGRGGVAELTFTQAGSALRLRGVRAESGSGVMAVEDGNVVLEIGDEGLDVPILSLAGTLRFNASADVVASTKLMFTGATTFEIPQGEVVTLDAAAVEGSTDYVLTVTGGGTLRIVGSALVDACSLRLAGAKLEVLVPPDDTTFVGSKAKVCSLVEGSLEDLSPFLRSGNALTLDPVEGTFSIEGGALYVETPSLTPIAVWNGDFTELSKGRWTLALNGNTPLVEGGVTNALAIATASKGVQARSTSTSTALTVLVRCRDLDLESEKNQTLFTTHVPGATAKAGTDQVGLYVKAADDKAYGVWEGKVWDGGSSAALTDTVTRLTFAYHCQESASSPGVHAYMGTTNETTMTTTQIFSASNLRASGSSYDGFAVGGDWSGLTGLPSASNMVITAMAIFERKLTKDEVAAYEFPSFEEEASVVSWVGGASSNWSDAANWSGGEVPTADDIVTIFADAEISVTADDEMPQSLMVCQSATLSGELKNAPRLYVAGGATLTLKGAATVTSLAGAGSLVLSEGATIAPPSGATLVTFFADWSGVISGKGALTYTSLPGNATVQAYLQNADKWQATIAFENLDVTWLDLNKYGNASSVIRLTGCRGYLAASNSGSGRTFVPTLELRNGTDGYGFRVTDGCTNDKIAFSKVVGDGTYEVAKNLSVSHFFPDVSSFKGKFKMGSTMTKPVVYVGSGLSDGASADAGSFYISPRLLFWRVTKVSDGQCAERKPYTLILFQ